MTTELPEWGKMKQNNFWRLRHVDVQAFRHKLSRNPYPTSSFLHFHLYLDYTQACIQTPTTMFDFLKPSHYHHNHDTTDRDFTQPTVLLLLNNQAAFAHPFVPGPTLSRSNLLFEVNLTSLLAAFRVAREATSSSSSVSSPGLGSSSPSILARDHKDKDKNKEKDEEDVKKNDSHLEIIHIFHASENPASPLHPQHPLKGVRPLDFARPLLPDADHHDDTEPSNDEGEKVLWQTLNSSAPISSDLEAHLRQRGIRQLLVAGLTTDHAVSTTVRMAANKRLVDPENIILVADATATWAKAEIDAETVHRVSVASLEGEFAEVMGTEDVVKALRRVR